MATSGTRELRKLIKDLGKLPADLRKELRPMMRAAAERPLAAARGNASWSTRIPQATRVATSFSKRSPGVALVVDRRRAPHARVLENQGRPGWVRHPVFGNRRVWVRQQAQPFLWPAARPWLREVDKDIGLAVDATVRRYGFK